MTCICSRGKLKCSWRRTSLSERRAERRTSSSDSRKTRYSNLSCRRDCLNLKQESEITKLTSLRRKTRNSKMKSSSTKTGVRHCRMNQMLAGSNWSRVLGIWKGECSRASQLHSKNIKTTVQRRRNKLMPYRGK